MSIQGDRCVCDELPGLSSEEGFTVQGTDSKEVSMLFCFLHGYTGCFFYRLLSQYVKSDAVLACDKSMVLGKCKVTGPVWP